MQRKLRISNRSGRDAGVVFASLKQLPVPERGCAEGPVEFVRWLEASDATHPDALAQEYGEGLAEAMIAGDPDFDPVQTGRYVGSTTRVWVSSSGELLYAPPKMVEVIRGPDYRERERREPVDVEANVAEEVPLRWAGRRMSKREAMRRFAFKRSLQVQHVDGLTYDFCYEMAAELHEAGEVVLVGGGVSGSEPLIFQANSTPYRGFLEGRVDGRRYMLLLHLSNLELKRPE